VSARQSPLAAFCRDFRRNRLAVVGLLIVTVLLLAALSSFVVAPYDVVVSQERTQRLAGPTGAHWLGCDELGRDVFLRLLYGSRVSLLVGITVVAIGMTMGTMLGLVSGHFGGWVDSVIMRIVDIFLAFPFFLLAIAVAGFLGPSLRNAILALGIASVPSYTRIVRGSVLSIREMTFVESAVVAGAGNIRIMVVHIFPNLIGTLLVYGTLRVSTAIMAEAGLSYLGIGAQDPLPTWGKMLSNLREHMLFHPWHILAPGMAILITVMGFNFLGDGLRDLLDPRLRKVMGAQGGAE
jgi:peptide/nickel transport system permease protein